MIAVVDYGASNVPSVLRGLRAVHADATVTADPETVRRAPRVVVPGVGNFAPAMRRLAAAGLADALREVARSGRPILGICLGLQLFLQSSDEAPGVPGLGLLAGRVRRFATDLPVPHVGWAKVTLTERGRAHAALRRAFPGGDAFFYHVHSYRPDGVEPAADLADAEYGAPFATIVGRDAALREVHEEAGLSPVRLYNVSRVESFYLPDRDAVALVPVFAAFVDPAARPALSVEHDRAEWLPAAQAAARFAWPRERRAIEDLVALLGSGSGDLLDDALRVC